VRDSIARLYPVSVVVVVREGRRVCPHPPRVGPGSSYLQQKHSAVSCLAVVSTRTSLHLLHAFTRCCGELRWASRLTCTVFSHLLLIPYLATQDVKLTCVSLLCRFAMPTPTPILRSASPPPLSITSLRVLSAKYPYSKMFVGGLSWDTTDGTFFPPYITSHSLPLFAMSCPFY
jgi:hypothetical protein